MASSMSIKITGNKKVISTLRRYNNLFGKLVGMSVVEAGREVLIPAMKEQLKENGSIVTGKLANSLMLTFKSDMRSRVIVDLVATVPYAASVEQGAPPHEPDRSTIKDWVRIKTGATGQGAKKLVNAVIKTIREKGSDPHPFMMPAIQSSKDEFARRVVRKVDIKLGRETGR